MAMDEYLEKLGLDLSDSVKAAKELLGKKLAYNSPDGRVSGYIVETEAYSSEEPASHSFGGIKNRNATLFERSGTVYVYFTYGLHFCMNVVTGQKGDGQAVLIRALEPLEGIDIMKVNRNISNLTSLTNGPAKLTQALGVNMAQNGTSILEGPMTIEPGIKVEKIVTDRRIGITKAVDLPWRFYINGNPYVSRTKPS